MMDAAATILRDSDVTQEIGVVDRAEPALHVRAAGGLYRAKTATSCLVTPEPADRVLVAVAASGEAWVLAVLERAADSAVPLHFEGDVELSSTGTIRVEGDEGVGLRSDGEVGIASRRLNIRAVDIRAFAERLGFVGGAAQIQAENLKSVVSYVDQVFERVSTRMKRYYRFVEEIEMARAREIDIRAEKTVHVRSQNTFLNAKELVKVEGDQIHLG